MPEALPTRYLALQGGYGYTVTPIAEALINNTGLGYEQRFNKSLTPQIGRSTGGNTPTTLNDTGARWPVNRFANQTLRIISGTGSGQVRTVTANTATQITISAAWATTPDITSVYYVNVWLSKRRRAWSLVFPNLIPGMTGPTDNTYRQVRKFYEAVTRTEAFFWWDPYENPNPASDGSSLVGRRIVRFDSAQIPFVFAGVGVFTAQFNLIEVQGNGGS